MAETLWNIFLVVVVESREYREWGWNVLTIGAIGIVALVFVEGWGAWKQNQKIWREKSGESVSVIFFSYNFFSFTALIFYGAHIASGASILNGLLAFFYIPILLGLWKFKGFTRKEKVLFFLYSMMVPAIAILPWKDEVFLIISLGIVYSVATVPWELWKMKKSGAVEIKLLIVFLVSTVFWVSYSFAIHEWVLEILTTINLILLGLATILWFRYRARERALVQ